MKTRPRRFRRFVNVLGLMSLLAGLTGCASLMEGPFYRAPYWDVEIGPLDYLQFKYVPGLAEQGEEPQETVVIDLMGNGYMTMVAGKSGRLDPFAHAEKGHVPLDERRDQIVLSESDTQAVFQALVDRGFFDRKHGHDSESLTVGPHLLVAAKVNGRRHMETTDRREIMNLYKSLIAVF